MLVADRPATPAAIRTDLGAIFVSMELSKSIWLVTSLSPGAGERLSKHCVRAGDIAGLLARFADLRGKASARTGYDYGVIVIQEADLDGFWIHRVLEQGEYRKPCRRSGFDSDLASASGAPRPIRSMARRLCERRWRTSAASPVSAPWCECRARRRKTGAGSPASARFSSPNERGTSIASRACSLGKASPVTSRYVATASNSWRNCVPAMADRSRSTSRRRSTVNSTGSSC
jgi:hypothetical protein